MPSVDAVEDALLRAGEWRAARNIGGFRAHSHADNEVIVRWHPPEGDPDSGDAVAFVEEYARVLRMAGIPATVILDSSGPRVLCVPNRSALEAEPPALHQPPDRLSRTAH